MLRTDIRREFVERIRENATEKDIDNVIFWETDIPKKIVTFYNELFDDLIEVMEEEDRDNGKTE